MVGGKERQIDLILKIYLKKKKNSVKVWFDSSTWQWIVSFSIISKNSTYPDFIYIGAKENVR